MTVADHFDLTRPVVRRPTGWLAGTAIVAVLLTAGAGLHAADASGGRDVEAPCQARVDDVAALDVQAAGGTVC